jgi:hypothetical protein
MSREKFEKYKELHSEYISRFVDLHNYHQAFLDFPSYMKGGRVRRAVTDMIILGKNLRKLSLEVTSEHKKNTIEDRQSLKKEKARLKAIPKKVGRPRIKEPLVRRTTIGRPRKNKNDNNTTN